MIVNGAVKIYDKRQKKEIIIPCHRHGDAFYILYEFGYHVNQDFEEIEQGFLDNYHNFVSRAEAFDIALNCHQISQNQPGLIQGRLFSEDVW